MIDIIKEILKPEYNFLREETKIANKMCLLTLGGSYAYGTNKNDGSSDIDLRGIAVNTKDIILGITPDWETFVETNTDTVIYSIKKIVKLLMSCNPNTCEILGTRDEDVLFINKIGQMLRDNKSIFLSKRALGSFRGYANQQFSRMYNFHSKNHQDQNLKEEAMLRSCENKMIHFNGTYKNYKDGMMELYLADSNLEDIDKEVVIDISNIKKYPLRELHSLLNDFNSVLTDYKKFTVNHRGRKSTAEKLAKHQMHLFRLYFMLLDILEKQDIVTYREKEHDFLMDVRNGCFINGDKISDDLIIKRNELEEQVKYAIKHTELPDNPDTDKINELMIEIHKEVLNNE